MLPELNWKSCACILCLNYEQFTIWTEFRKKTAEYFKVKCVNYKVNLVGKGHLHTYI